MQLPGGGTGKRGGRGLYEGGGWVKGTRGAATDMEATSLLSTKEVSRSSSARFILTGDIVSPPPPLLHTLLLVLMAVSSLNWIWI